MRGGGKEAGDGETSPLSTPHEYIQSDIFTLPVFSATINIRKIWTSIFPTSDKRDV